MKFYIKKNNKNKKQNKMNNAGPCRKKKIYFSFNYGTYEISTIIFWAKERYFSVYI